MSQSVTIHDVISVYEKNETFDMRIEGKIVEKSYKLFTIIDGTGHQTEIYLHLSESFLDARKKDTDNA